jgi:hypothetical protein
MKSQMLEFDEHKDDVMACLGSKGEQLIIEGEQSMDDDDDTLPSSVKAAAGAVKWVPERVGQGKNKMEAGTQPLKDASKNDWLQLTLV